MVTTPDTAAIGEARRGDRAAFQTLIGPLLEPGCQLAYSILRDWQEAEDAVQDAALNAWRAVGGLHPGTPSLRPWFFTIVVNCCRTRTRRGWWRVLRVEPRALSARAAPGDDFQESWVRSTDLARALRKLPEPQRRLLVLRYYLDLPLEEAALVMGISPAAAKSRLHRALATLRPVLESEFPA